ncbi:MAG TPA: pyrroline-5-carboxylate reductase [Bryobacteraceae bacterium]|nr:pyrroline-5-carboxylate reductase [Bryobacteraceae bacterium]
MTLGFLGTGAITAAMVTGLNSEGGPCHDIRLSPRNAVVAADLASRFDNVSVCASNQEVLDTSDIVVLAVRPQVAEDVLSGLQFRSSQRVISLIAGFSVRRIADLVTPAHQIWRAIPLPSVARRRSPIAVYPAGGAGAELFAPLGQVFGMETEDHLNAFSTATSTMAAYFGFVGHIASWVARKGVPEQQGREYMARMFAGLTDGNLEGSQLSFEDLAAAHATPGGLNEQVLRDLTDHGVFDTLTRALDSVHRRASGQCA